MKRFLLVLVAVVGVGACNKPTAEDCRAAIANMQDKLGTSEGPGGHVAENEGEVRRCKGGSTRESVACAKNATTKEQLKACDLWGTKKPQ